MEERIKTICGIVWTVIKENEEGTYYLLYGTFGSDEFGKINNYADSYIRKNLNESDLARDLKEKFGDKLVPIKTNLLSMDGLDDYDEVKGAVLAIPTVDIYRECRKRILLIEIVTGLRRQTQLLPVIPTAACVAPFGWTYY